MAMYEFTIHGRLPDLNDILSQSATRKGSWSQWGATKKREMARVSDCIYQAGRPEKMFIDPVYIAFTFYEPNRKRDVDNVSAGAHKIILDALQETEVIKNDNQRYVRGYQDTFRHDPVAPRIEVAIYTEREWEQKRLADALRRIEETPARDTDWE